MLGLDTISGLCMIETLICARQRGRSAIGGVREIAGHCVLAAATLFFLYWVAYREPVLFVRITIEDSWIEYVNFLGWASAALLAGLVLHRRRNQRNPGLIVFALVCAIFAMEEISWGQRLLGVGSPRFFREHNLQSELSLHNFIRSEQYYAVVAALIAAAGVILPAAAKQFRPLRDLCEGVGVPLVPISLWPFMLLPGFFMGHYDRYVVPLPDRMELGEMFAGIAASLLALDSWLDSARPQIAHRLTRAAVSAGLLAAISVCAAPLAVYSYDGDAFRKELHRHAAYRFPKLDMNAQAVALGEYVARHPELASEGSRLHHGLALRRLGRSAESEAVLEAMLLDLSRMRRNGFWAERRRLEAKVLIALGREGEAVALARRTAAAETSRAGRELDAAARANAYTGIALTWLLAGHEREAERWAIGAYQQAPNRAARRRIDTRLRWEARGLETLDMERAQQAHRIAGRMAGL